MLPWNKIFLKRLRIGPYEVAALVIIALAVLLRLILTARAWPETDSDEGTMGLEAMHIAFRGEHPLFLYGQNYMGMIEAYLGALLFRLFGVSLFSLRLGMVILFALFLVSLYLLTSLLYSKKLALVSLALLSVGAQNILIPEMRAVGGAVETLLFGTLILLLACWLALTADQEQLHHKRWRLMGYGGWGLTAGLGLWSHLLVCPFILIGGLILAIFCWRELRSWAPLYLLVGLVIGAFPLIYYNATAPWGQNSLTIAWQIHSTSNTGIAPGQVTFIKQIAGTLFYSLPIATGLSPLCNLQELPLFGPASSRTAVCTIVQGSWSVGYIILMVLATFMAIIPLWKLWHQRRSRTHKWTPEERQASIIYFGRLALLCSAGLTLMLFALSPLAAEKPWSTRYLIGLLIITPAVIWPLWSSVVGASRRGGGGVDAGRRPLWSPVAGTSRRGGGGVDAGRRPLWSPVVEASTAYQPPQENKHGRQLLKNIRAPFGIGILVLLAGTFLVGTISNFSAIPRDESLLRQDAVLTHDLLRIGARHIYSGYWVCDRLTFASQEQIICSVVDLQLKPGLNRYPPYHAVVAADPKAPYVFPARSDFALAAIRNPALSSGHYRRLILDGYIIYQPENPPSAIINIVSP